MKLDVQFITHPGVKERLVVIPESQFRVLERAAKAGLTGQKSGMSAIPQDVLDKITAGENPVRVVRLWRGLTGRQLAALTGISASMLSQIEHTGKTGSTKTFKVIASVLDVPMELIFPNHANDR
jgi:DNA-binding XRE family transcriptional regulator